MVDLSLCSIFGFIPSATSSQKENDEVKVDNHESFYPAELHVFQNSKSTILMRMFTEEYIFNNLLRGKKSLSTPRVLSILSSVLERSIQKNESSSKASKKNEVVTIFHCSQAPSLSIRQYIERIFKYSRCSPSCFVVAYIYLDRFLQRIKGCLARLNVHRLLITSLR
ncbi:hypothetical protein CUMW_259240 [Citrus unshiu]|uniref:Uncharacterized protein n=2 Tax=Citrus TaxID=2706 RepID=A0A2H5QU21_CITUN|nr:hypothetical protein CUMW_259240 [Citrus unshiu]